MKRRWEVVATMSVPDVKPWVIPASEGKEFHHTWFGARLAARDHTRRAAWAFRRNPYPVMTWIVRRRRS